MSTHLYEEGVTEQLLLLLHEGCCMLMHHPKLGHVDEGGRVGGTSYED